MCAQRRQFTTITAAHFPTGPDRHLSPACFKPGVSLAAHRALGTRPTHERPPFERLAELGNDKRGDCGFTAVGGHPHQPEHAVVTCHRDMSSRAVHRTRRNRHTPHPVVATHSELGAHKQTAQTKLIRKGGRQGESALNTHPAAAAAAATTPAGVACREHVQPLQQHHRRLLGVQRPHAVRRQQLLCSARRRLQLGQQAQRVARWQREQPARLTALLEMRCKRVGRMRLQLKQRVGVRAGRTASQWVRGRSSGDISNSGTALYCTAHQRGERCILQTQQKTQRTGRRPGGPHPVAKHAEQGRGYCCRVRTRGQASGHSAAHKPAFLHQHSAPLS